MQAGTIELDLIGKFLPDGGTALRVVPLALVAAAVAGWPAIRLRRQGVAAPYTRKLFHFTIFSIAAIVHAWRGAPGVVTYGVVIAVVVLAAVATRSSLFDALARPSDAPRERWFVVAPLISTAIGGLASNLLFGSHAMVGYLVAGWGDAVAEPVGTRWGRHRYRVHSMFGVAATRSLEGSAAVLVAGTAAAFLGLLVLDVRSWVAIPIAIAIGIAGALVEGVSTHGLDNLTVQVAASGVAGVLVRLLSNH